MENIIDFCVELSRRMIVSGANLERVQRALDRICTSYGVEDKSVFLMSGYISMAGKLQDGTYVSRQAAIPTPDNHLQRLKQLNRLCYRIVEAPPDPGMLGRILDEASCVKEVYPDWVIDAAQIMSLSCVCLLFGGGPGEVVTVMAIVFSLQRLLKLISRAGLDQVVVNVLTMAFAAGLSYLIMTDFGLDIPVVLITISIMVIPGITLVNAVRNLLCGNEMNGIIQLLRVAIETEALAFGIIIVFWITGLQAEITEMMVSGPTQPVLLIILAFVISVCTGITFHIPPHDLFFAGLGGAISRITLILITVTVKNPMAYAGIAALIAALYAEYLATRRQDPSTYFVYPSILPMIPGGTFYYSAIGLYAGNVEMFETNGKECILTLIGMSIGFVFSSIIAHYARKMKYHDQLANQLTEEYNGSGRKYSS